MAGRHHPRGHLQERDKEVRTIALSCIALLGAAVAFGQAAPEAPVTLSLEQAMRRSLEANPQARGARAEIEVAEAQRKYYRSAVLPQVSFNGSSTTNAEEVTLDFEGQDVTILPQNDYSYSVTLSQPIFAGGRELKTIRQARLAVDSARAGVRSTENQLLLQTASAYLAAVGGEALVEVENRNLELALKRRQQSADFLEAGEVTQVDVLRADTAVKSAERRLASATEAREVGLSELRVALALDTPVAVENPSLSLPALPSEEELVAMALAKRPEVNQAAVTRQTAAIEVSKQRAARLPVITAEATARTQRADFPSDQTGALTFNFSLPLFDSGAIGARVAQATERRKQAEFTLENTQREVREDVRQALISLRSAETNLALAREQLAAAEAEYAQTFELYRAQEITSLDVAAAENILTESRRAVVTGTFDRHLAELRVWYATGSLKDVVLGTTEAQ